MNLRIWALSLIMGCGAASAPATSSGPAHPTEASTADAYPGCQASAIEPDLKPTPTQVVDSTTPPADDVWISTTYLALTPDPQGQAAFRSLMTELLRVLPTTPGLISFQFSTSERCLSARTLAVWKDESSMNAFVRSPAHHAAMRQSNLLSRGSSTFTHWQGPIESANWNYVAEELARQDGPYQ